ncbi:MAG: DeoR/GlpR family DNA-binding transcription regulator [Fusobacteriaceae bacterium]
MFIEERHKKILEILDENGKVLVKDLSKKFEISESMIRKDLQVLEKMKLLQRTYGGAIKLKLSFIKPESFSSRITKDAELKEIIAKKAFDLVQDNEVIFLDASTTSYMIAKLVIEGNKSITVITNMLEISSLIPMDSKIKFIFVGGDFNPIVGGSIGSYSIEQIKKYRCNKAFIGCNGITLCDGYVGTGISEEAITKSTIMGISKERFLITSNEKFETISNFIFSNLIDFDGLITEARPDKNILKLLEEYNINLI